MLLGLILLLACNPDADGGPMGSTADGGSTDGGAVFEDCDPAVTIPWAASSDPIPAEPHADSFGSNAPDPFHVHLQWPARDTSRSVAMLWRTDVDTLASVVEFGPADGFPDNATRVEGYSFRYGGPAAGEGDQRIHEVRLCGLMEPGTTYSYRVGGDGHWSDTYTYAAPGAPGSFDSFRVAILGDSRGNYATWGQVLAAAAERQPDFIIFNGDMVDIGSLQSQWDDWFEATGDVLAHTVLVPAHGNHEFLAQHYFAQFAAPGNEEWFALDYGPLLLLTLNDTVRDSADISDVQRKFIESELAGTDATWKIASHHHTAYSICSTHGSDLDVRAAWSPAFEDGGVQLVTAGHNHTYERSVPIKDGVEVAPGQGTVYLVTGGAGAPLYTGTDPDWFNAVSDPIEHYVIADVGPDSMDVVVRDIDDNVIDEFSLTP
ncbi:MAG: metallophosphoesterase family protein [Deltaproteobacteria bacterium]|nr:MAG: metallophosphoesterase family protein [Deltaproteobacteria bacterium]